MMDNENKKLLKDSLEIIKKYSNKEDADVVSSLLQSFDSNELDESTFNQLVHNFYMPTPDQGTLDGEQSKERGAR
jgi:hypothetical protein